MEKIPENVLHWLVEKENPSMRYRTMNEIQKTPSTDKKMIETHQLILQSSSVQKIKKSMHPEGYWTINKSDGRVIGKGVEYATFNTTHSVLGFLAELGVTREEPWVELATDRYLSLQASDEILILIIESLLIAPFLQTSLHYPHPIQFLETIFI